MRREKVHLKSDERTLGDSDFVETALDFASEAAEQEYRLKADGYPVERVGKRVAELLYVPFRCDDPWQTTSPGISP